MRNQKTKVLLVFDGLMLALPVEAGIETCGRITPHSAFRLKDYKLQDGTTNLKATRQTGALLTSNRLLSNLMREVCYSFSGFFTSADSCWPFAFHPGQAPSTSKIQPATNSTTPTSLKCCSHRMLVSATA